MITISKHSNDYYILKETVQNPLGGGSVVLSQRTVFVRREHISDYDLRCKLSALDILDNRIDIYIIGKLIKVEFQDVLPDIDYPEYMKKDNLLNKDYTVVNHITCEPLLKNGKPFSRFYYWDKTETHQDIVLAK